MIASRLRRFSEDEKREVKEELARFAAGDAEGKANVIIYIAIVEDRHTDTEVYPFSIPAAAIDFARATALQNARTEADVEESPIDGWLYHATYSTEGDSVRVVAKDLDL